MGLPYESDKKLESEKCFLKSDGLRSDSEKSDEVRKKIASPIGVRRSPIKKSKSPIKQVKVRKSFLKSKRTPRGVRKVRRTPIGLRKVQLDSEKSDRSSSEFFGFIGLGQDSKNI